MSVVHRFVVSQVQIKCMKGWSTKLLRVFRWPNWIVRCGKNGVDNLVITGGLDAIYVRGRQRRFDSTITLEEDVGFRQRDDVIAARGNVAEQMRVTAMKYVPEGAAVLDFGSGTGKIVKVLWS